MDDKDLPDYIELADKIYEILKGENCRKAEDALYHLIKEIKGKSFITE